jgi:predicted GH43/DUF377 family glycosyl hydrolase
MLRRLSNHCLLRPADLAPSREDLEVLGAFNPGAVATPEGVVLLVRVAERPRERRTGMTALPRWDPAAGDLAVDWVADGDLEPVDARVVRRKADGLARLTSISHLRVVRCGDGRRVEALDPGTLGPADGCEAFGIEDPRLTPMADACYFTYVAVSRHGAATALASTRDFRSFQRHGIIFPPENKDVLLFPEPVGGLHLALHRPSGAPFTHPEMWLAASPDLVHWGHHGVFRAGDAAWELGRVGGGAPPLRLPQGWLEIYHGCAPGPGGRDLGVYSAGALLLDRDDPRRILGRSPQLFRPEARFETEGFVPGVVFPTGIVARGDTVLVYYGAADTCSAVVEFSLAELLASCG